MYELGYEEYGRYSKMDGDSKTNEDNAAVEASSNHQVGVIEVTPTYYMLT